MSYGLDIFDKDGKKIVSFDSSFVKFIAATGVLDGNVHIDSGFYKNIYPTFDISGMPLSDLVIIPFQLGFGVADWHISKDTAMPFITLQADIYRHYYSAEQSAWVDIDYRTDTKLILIGIR